MALRITVDDVPVWVISCRGADESGCPLYPRKRTPALSCRSCRPNAPFAELVRLSRTSVVDEMREEHRLTLRCLLHWNLAFAISIAPRRVERGQH
jgi:hypothetical protein